MRKYATRILNYESEEETKNLDSLDEQNKDNLITQNEKEKFEKRMAQLAKMVE